MQPNQANPPILIKPLGFTTQKIKLPQEPVETVFIFIIKKKQQLLPQKTCVSFEIYVLDPFGHRLVEGFSEPDGHQGHIICFTVRMATCLEGTWWANGQASGWVSSVFLLIKHNGLESFRKTSSTKPQCFCVWIGFLTLWAKLDKFWSSIDDVDMAQPHLRA